MEPSDLQIKDLGELIGEVLIFGGPYSNLQATDAVLSVAKQRAIAPARCICTGDAVAYCANPAETLHLLDGACNWVAGNCEKQLTAAADDCGCGFAEGSACDRLSRGWYPFALNAISGPDRALMGRCPDMLVFEHLARRYAVIHGGISDISRFIWPQSDKAVFTQEIAEIQAVAGRIDAVLADHCGVAFQRDIDGVEWINAGAIGMPPHDGGARTRYVILGENGARIERLSYDVDAAVDAMQINGLTQGYDIALKTGYWPSEDVLPAALRR